MSRQAVRISSLVAVFSIATGCTSLPPETPEKPLLTPELAKAALLELMQPRKVGDSGLFDRDEWAKVPIEDLGNGWYAFGDTFRINPSRAVYTMTIRPKPGFRACTFVDEGTFVLMEDGRWCATAPKPGSSALQAGE